MRVQSLGWEDPLKKETVAYSSISCLDKLMDKEVWRATVHGVEESNMTKATQHAHNGA